MRFFALEAVEGATEPGREEELLPRDCDGEAESRDDTSRWRGVPAASMADDTGSVIGEALAGRISARTDYLEEEKTMLLISPLAGVAAIVAAVAGDASDDRNAATDEILAAYERGVNERVGVMFSRAEADHLIGGAAMLNALLQAREDHPDPGRRAATASLGENELVLMRLVEEVWNTGKTEVCDEIIHPTYVAHNPPQGGAEFRGAAGVKAFVELFRAGFPDVKIVVDDIFGEGDQVAWRLRWTATHTGVYMGMPPSNRRLDVAVIGVNRLVDGKIVESWGVVDHLGSMQQLGVIPSIRGAEARAATVGAPAREAA